MDAADGACAAGAEEDFVGEDAVAPDVGDEVFSWDGHGC